MSDEAFYDEQIAPELRKLAELCKERGIPFAACVQYDPTGGCGITCVGIEEEVSPGMWMAAAAMLAGANVDLFYKKLMQHPTFRDHGPSSSLVLKLLAQEEAPSRRETPPNEVVCHLQCGRREPGDFTYQGRPLCRHCENYYYP